MTPIAEARLSIHLDRERAMIFNFNTIRKYEESGKPYWDTMINLFDTYENLQKEIEGLGTAPTARQIGRLNLSVLAHISMTDLQTLVWASVHEYGGPKKKTAIWPLEMDEMGMYLHPSRSGELLRLVAKGYMQNAPSKEELGEVSGAGPQIVAPPAEAAQKASESGGDPSIELPADAFASASQA